MEKTDALGSVVKELLTPAVKRIGLTIATILVTYGVAAEHADIVVNSVGALAAVGFDLMVVLIRRKRRGA